MNRPPYIAVDFDADSPRVEAGGTLRGTVRAVGGYLAGPRRVLLKVGYFIEGQGTPERKVFLDEVVTNGFVPADEPLEYPFELSIPEDGPLSYDGQCLTITWKAVLEEVRHRRFNRRHSFVFRVIAAGASGESDDGDRPTE